MGNVKNWSMKANSRLQDLDMILFLIHSELLDICRIERTSIKITYSDPLLEPAISEIIRNIRRWFQEKATSLFLDFASSVRGQIENWRVDENQANFHLKTDINSCGTYGNVLR